jgi:DNA-binding SARP family transcriptional activator/tetratricopeptide (TPR) repeat protein
MKFLVLGCLEAETEGVPLDLGGPREKRLVAALLLEADRVVSLARLGEVMWDGDPPPTGEKQIRNAISEVRIALAGAGAHRLVTTHPGGYRLAVSEEMVDATEFEALVRQARREASAGRIGDAARLLRSALDLWRGPFLAGMGGSAIEAAAAMWEERRWAARELLYECELDLGNHREVIPELTAFAAAHPLRERPVAQLMMALHRSGRQADALAVYERARHVLAADMGLDPGPALRQLHQLVLSGDLADSTAPGLTSAGAHGDEERRPAVAVPRQLPGSVRYFAGRTAELAVLQELVDQAASTSGMVVISAIGGMAGVGKTALAVRFAHQAAGAFPEGQLSVNLRGFDPSAAPVTAQAAMRGLLDALGVPAARVPADLEGQAALYRSLLAGRRMLILLDNVRDAGQVEPLLPGTPGCLVLITSRNQLTSLVVATDACQLELDVLSSTEARELLAGRLGLSRIAAEPQATEEIIAQCAGLPLALAIAAANAAADPIAPLAGLAAELRNGRLDALDGGDSPSADIRAVFSVSYAALSPAARSLFRLLSLHPGPDFTAAAVASLAGQPGSAVRRILAELTRAHMVTRARSGRYGSHDLVRAYAAEMCLETDSSDLRQRARGRIFDHYLQSARAADMLLDQSIPVTVERPLPDVRPEIPADRVAALAWFNAEQAVLLSAISGAEPALDAHTWRLAWTLWGFLDHRGLWREQSITQQAAIAAAVRLGDRQGQAHGHCTLARPCAQEGRLDDAETHLRQALSLFSEAGHLAGQAVAHHNLAIVCGQVGRDQEALDHARRALAITCAGEDKGLQARDLNLVGWCEAQLGNYRSAVVCCEQALVLHTDIHYPTGHAGTWDTLGFAYHKLGQHDQAVACYRRAVSMYRDIGHRYYEADTLAHLAECCFTAGKLTEARHSWEQAEVIFSDVGPPRAAEIRGKLAALQ